MEITGVSIRALGVALSTAFRNGLSEVAPTWNMVATEVPSSTAENDYAWLADFPSLREWIGERRVKELAGYDYTLKNRLFEGTVTVKRTNLEDDNIGIYSTLAGGLGRAAAAWPDELVWSLLPQGFSTVCFDGQNYFDTDHPVVDPATGATTSVSNMQTGSGPAWFLFDTKKALKPLIFQKRLAPEFVSLDDAEASERAFMRDEYLYGARARGNAGFGYWQLGFGSKADLTVANFNAAVDAMSTLRNDEGRPLAIKPSLLVVPPQLRVTADQIVRVQRLANGADNPNYQIVDYVVSPWLA